MTNGANLDLNGFGIYCNRILRCLWIQGEGSDLHNGIMDFSGNRVIDVGGTLSHHHGVGRSKAPMMRREQGGAIDVVRGIKRALDPRGILNPGSLIPVSERDDA